MERLENAHAQVEALDHESPTPQNALRLQAALIERRDAFVDFANLSRRMQSESYNKVVVVEERRRIRHDYLAHPLETWKRERHNRNVRRLAPPV